MTIFSDIPPTAGLPLHWRDIAAAWGTTGSGDVLARDFKSYLPIAYTRITCSGTAALFLICEALKELTPRRTIIIPSFICPLVAFAVKRAGFTIEVCDIGNDSFNFSPADLEALCSANKDIAAVVIDHLAGIPFDLAAIEPTVKKYNLFVIEDCAQSLGARSRGSNVGTAGDFSFFSLAAGKGLTLYEGGVVATDQKQYGALIDAAIERLVKNNVFIETLRILELLGYVLFYRPRLFWFVFTLPQLCWTLLGDTLKAAREDFDIDFPVHRVSSFRKTLGHAVFPRIEEEIERQRQKAYWYMEDLKNTDGITVLGESPADRATYPYVTVLFDDPGRKKAAMKYFAGSGLGVSQVYALAISDYGYLKKIVPDRNCDHARSFAGRSITLSTSTFITRQDVQIITGAIRRLR